MSRREYKLKKREEREVDVLSATWRAVSRGPELTGRVFDLRINIDVGIVL